MAQKEEAIVTAREVMLGKAKNASSGRPVPEADSAEEKLQQFQAQVS